MKVSEGDISEILDQRLNYANFQVLDKSMQGCVPFHSGQLSLKGERCNN